jgi:hypothetical protein
MNIAFPLGRLSHLFLLLALCVFGAAGQANRASIKGTVTDSTGAVIVNVEITARNMDTNEETNTVSNGDGLYLVQNLPPGAYSLTFRKSGFKEVRREGLTLISTQVAGIDISMQIGTATENITVTAEAPVLDSQSVSIGTNMNGKVVTDLPMSIYGGGRFVENFAVALTPGYSPISSPYGAVVNGTQWFTKDYTIDGTTATSSIRGDSIETGPSMEAVEELQAQTSGLDSASAITSGGVMSFTLKSGTNQFHGSIFGYGHNEFLDANTWTNDLTGAPKAKARAWDYGASVGGPIFKNKLFFFGTFERYTQVDFTLGGFTQFVPTTDMLNGDFSALLDTSTVLGKDKAGNTVYKGAIFDPTTGDIFPGNKIPTTRFSSVAQKILAVYQKDYVPGQAGLNGNNQFPLSNSPDQTPNQGVVKLDYDMTTKDRLSGSWVINNRPRTLLDSGGIWQNGSTDGGPLANARLQVVKSDGYRASESHTFSPNVVNVFNETYNWYWNGSSPASTGTNWNSQLGFGATGADNFPGINFGGAVNGLQITNIGNQWQGYSTGATYITGDTLTWNKGRHALSFGGDFRAYQVNSHTGSGANNFNFSPNTTNGGFSGAAGFGFASFLLGDVTTASQTTAFDLYGRRKSMTLFAQDSYKITPRLTLTAGLRWQYAWQYHEKYGHWANFDLAQIDPKYGYPGNLVFAKGGGDSFERKEYWDGLGPQIGFAYSPTSKWVVRGSFSLTLLPANGPYFNGVPNGFAPGFQGINSVNTPFNWDSGYPGVFQPGSKNVDPSTIFGLTYVDQHALMPAFTDTINVGIQYEFTPNMRLEVAYVGNRGHHLPDAALAWNEPRATTFLNAVNSNPGLVPYGDFSSWQFAGCTKGAPLFNQYTGVNYAGITCPYTGFNGPALAALAPSPQLANWSTATWFYYNLSYVGLPIGQSSYNSMVVDLLKRTGRGLTMDLNYTFSRSRGDTFSSQQEYNGAYTPVQDFGNISAAANSLTNYDLTHVVKGYVTYQLPFGKGQRWLSDKGGLVNSLVGGWSVNGLVSYFSGQPFHIGVNEPFYPIWGNFYPNFHPQGADGPFKPSGFNAALALNDPNYHYSYFAPGVASSPINGNTIAFGTGQAYDSSLRCPGQSMENASLLKYLSFGADGRYQLSLRVEFYNLFNRHTYAILGCSGSQTNVGDSNFAAVTGINSSPRTGQFGARFTF